MFITRRHPLLLAPDDGAGDGGIPAPEGAAPTPPETGTGTQEQPTTPAIPEGYVPEDRYKEAQAWGTRLAQERAELEAEAQLARALRSEDPEARKRAFEQLGVQFVDDDEDTQLYDEMDPRAAARIEALEQRLASEDAQREQQANYTAYREITSPEMKRLEIPERYQDLVADAALDLPALQTPQGPQPDIQGAWEQFVSTYLDPYLELPSTQAKARQAWAKTKPTTAVTSPTGRQGTHAPTLDTAEARADYVAQRVAELEADG